MADIPKTWGDGEFLNAPPNPLHEPSTLEGGVKQVNRRNAKNVAMNVEKGREGREERGRAGAGGGQGGQRGK